MSFSEQLKSARIAQGLTQQQVANMMGITNSTYCGYETGKRQPDVAKIKQLANILKTSGDILLETGFATDKNNGEYDLTTPEKALKMFESLRPDLQDYVMEQIKKLIELQGKK